VTTAPATLHYLGYLGDDEALRPALDAAMRAGFAIGRPPVPVQGVCLASLDHPAERLGELCDTIGLEQIVWLAAKAPVPYAWLAARRALRRIASWETEERRRDLELTLRTVREPSAWTPALHFQPGSDAATMSLTSSSGKHEVLREVEQFFGARPVLSAVRRLQLVQIAEELVTNALFNAPVDAAGAHPFRDRHRRQATVLEAGRAVDVALWADDTRFGIAVTDPFGSLTAECFADSLSRGFRRGDDQIRTTGGGAGIGLFTVYRASSHLTIAVVPGSRTQILALVDLPNRRFAAVRGLNAFWSKPVS
jgi:hypothetical protein